MVGQLINLRGFSTFSDKEDEAKEFSLKNWKSGCYPVVFCLNVSANGILEKTDDLCRPFKFRLDSSKYTMYPEDGETMLDDGAPFWIQHVQEINVPAFNPETG